MTHYTTKPSSPQEALAHYGKKGMKWGVRKDDSGSVSRKNPVKAAQKAQKAEQKSLDSSVSTKSIGQARKDVAALGKTARGIISESKRASTPAARAAAAKRYEKEVVAAVKTKDFKATYQKASTVGKGEMAMHVVAFGPLAAVTIPVLRSGRKNMAKAGYELEIDMAHDILREMRTP